MLSHIISITMKTWEEKDFYIGEASWPLLQDLARRMRKTENGIRAIIRTIEARNKSDFWYQCELRGLNIQRPHKYANSYDFGLDQDIRDSDFDIVVDDRDVGPTADGMDVEVALDDPCADVSEAGRMDPKDAFAYCIWAEAYLCMNEFHRAIAECNKAIRLDPTNASAYGIRGCAFRRIGDFERAIADCTEGLRLSPNYEWCKNQLEMARRKQR